MYVYMYVCMYVCVYVCMYAAVVCYRYGYDTLSGFHVARRCNADSLDKLGYSIVVCVLYVCMYMYVCIDVCIDVCIGRNEVL